MYVNIAMGVRYDKTKVASPGRLLKQLQDGVSIDGAGYSLATLEGQKMMPCRK